MKTFLLIITILLMLSRVSSTPRSLSKKVYKKYLEESSKSMADKISNKDENEKAIFKFMLYLISIVFNTFLICYYLYIGSKSSSNMIYFISVIQASSVLVYFWKDFIAVDPTDINSEDRKFNRWWELFNIILDYIYYPTVIYMLLQ